MIYIMPIIIKFEINQSSQWEMMSKVSQCIACVCIHKQRQRETHSTNTTTLKYYATQMLEFPKLMLSIWIDIKFGFKSSKLVCSMESFAVNRPQNVYGSISYVKWMRGTLICGSPSLPCINYVLFMSSQLKIRDVHVKPSLVDEGTLVTTSPLQIWGLFHSNWTPPI